MIMEMKVTPVCILPDGRLSRADAAKFLGLAAKTLAEWKRFGLGPMPHNVGGRVYYYLADLQAFVSSGAREARAPAGTNPCNLGRC
jgi:hypothetical protein